MVEDRAKAILEREDDNFFLGGVGWISDKLQVLWGSWANVRDVLDIFWNVMCPSRYCWGRAFIAEVGPRANSTLEPG